jgi:serine/threonine protein kinase
VAPPQGRGLRTPRTPPLPLFSLWRQHVYMVMDLMSGGDLEGVMLKRGRPYSDADAAFYTAEVVLGLLHLQQRGIVHRDLKVRPVIAV